MKADGHLARQQGGKAIEVYIAAAMILNEQQRLRVSTQWKGRTSTISFSEILIHDTPYHQSNTILEAYRPCLNFTSFVDLTDTFDTDGHVPCHTASAGLKEVRLSLRAHASYDDSQANQVYRFLD